MAVPPDQAQMGAVSRYGSTGQCDDRRVPAEDDYDLRPWCSPR
jgi:hypothetical protein